MPYMICALEDLDEIENIVPVEIVIPLQLAVLNGKIEYMYLQRRFVFMSSVLHACAMDDIL